ncbi:uncharacterized protein Z519_02448 [Cladophialophora bantiana CBS 173.52]|uniref:RNA helicase n=1 Tax=Cladophialophora bantiana (strain ATCC 10958 / CBS 173.52 / CDC B-1940 / NIH 8579) TaxID=1442370 RepID=A0A0D2F4D9_CLAB1|nr:uncharacterized protein Z519_02448 [Cladophialophora bantiana CBS 173.52]KIW97056.1 hypothetical protein Z519_02448 [Cladophialophora bantiana CBS 173.52]
MAPKKKKKPTANPARGFATTSLPSKSKTVDEPDQALVNVNDESLVAGTDTKLTARLDDEHAAPNSGKPSEHGLKIQDMTPEEFEAHLEESELETMLSKYANRCIADARRQVVRLETERRQLRPQAHRLSTYNWLPEETINDVFGMDVGDTNAVFPASRGVRTSVDEEKLSVDLWSLERVLVSLNFPSVSLAVAYITEIALLGQLTVTPDSLSGLPEALQWYASKGPATELMNYEQTTGTKTGLSGDSTPLQIASEPATGNQSRQSPAATPAGVAEAEEDSSASPEASESEEDNDPAKLTEKFVGIQQQIWVAQNEEANDRMKAVARKEKRIARLQSKLQQLCCDPLFDKQEAEAAWATILTQLQGTRQQLMRVAATKRREQKQAAAQQNIDDDTEIKKLVAEDNGPATAEDEDGLLGGMFGESEDTLIPQQNHPASESSIRLLDFGNWSGLSPKRLLDEVCRTRDSGCRVQSRTLQETSYSARHTLQISWTANTMPEGLATTALPPEIFAQVSERLWELEMRMIAAASTAQSEAYICTLGLFLVSTLGASEQKAIGRLPTVWRDVVKDLGEAKEKVVNKERKETLRRLRALIHETQERLKQQQAKLPSKELAKPLSNVSDRRRTRVPVSNWSPEQVSKEWNMRTSHSSFHEMLQIRQQLPVHQYKDQILSCIRKNAVSVICAETGAGKSSGIPVLLLEQEFSAGRDYRILVTQPRRISAITLARRVSQELGESRNDIGTNRSLVGYAIRLESKTSNTTRITYATTGVLLRMLEESPNLIELDCLILDEVHERTMDLDLLFIALQKLMKRRSTLKIVLMSATVDAKKFSDYFGGAPVLDLPGRTFPVEVGFLEDAVEVTNDLAGVKENDLVVQDEDQDFDEFYANDKGRPVIAEPEKYSSQTQQAVVNMDEYHIDYSLVAKLAATIATKPRYAKYSSAILIFMPGIGEMRRLYSFLLSMDTFGRNWVVHLLHSTFSTEELERAFERPPKGHRKIVIATNIAETGITIPDVTAVIDTCKEKIMRFDERRQLSRLTEGFISRSSARQRRGRAARVQEGLCFHLVTKHRYENLMLEQQVPEMLRLSLQDPILRIKVWNLGSIEETLNAAIEPPSRKNVLRAIDKLKDAGALAKNEALTPLGQQIARLPLEVLLAKLAIFGVIFRCLDPILAIISLLGSKSPFLPIPTSGSQIDARHAFSRGNSDLLSSLNAYESWKKAKAARMAQEFCRKNHISDQTMGQVEAQKIQLLVYLVDAGLVTLEPEERAALNRARTYSGRGGVLPSYDIPARYNQTVPDRALNAIIAMALYPRILMQEGKGWRNVYTNQLVSLIPRSVNHPSSSQTPKTAPTAPRWLSFYEAVQNTRSGALNVFETSAIPESALAMLLGAEAEFKFFAGVLLLDGGKVKLSVKRWRELMAVKILRERVLGVLEECYKRPGEVGEEGRVWLDMWLKIEAAQEG